MIPWFSSRVISNYVLIRPYGPLRWMLLACLAHAALSSAGQAALTWIVDLPQAGIAFWFMARWGIARTLSVRLLAMLHIAYVWAGIGFALFALDSLSQFVGWDLALGFAPLHVLGIGFFGAMLIGMATRVSRGHSGLPLEADGLTWTLFLLLQGVAQLRLLPDLFPTVLGYRTLALAATRSRTR